ncbi:MAG: hydroxymethylbilane synthase [Pseudanabaenaceae cyanobacterium]
MTASSPQNSVNTIRIGSRKSQLALVQTEWVKGELERHWGEHAFAVETMSTLGDNVLDVALAKIGDKGLFTKELEDAMLSGRVDLAVHSLKDLPTRLPAGLMLGAVTEREDPADALVVAAKHRDRDLATLPAGAIVGTSSLRRLAQLRHHFPHLAFKDVRGNLNTRLAKLDAGEYDALILAAAGLTRLGMGHRIHQRIPAEISYHAVGQGALGIECRSGDDRILTVLSTVAHQPTTYRCLAERAFLRELEGGCQVPIGVQTELQGDRLILRGLVASVDGQRVVKGEERGLATDGEALGIALAQVLKGQGAQAILDEITAQARS